MWIVGIDLAGPANAAETAMACFETEGDHLRLAEWREGLGDEQILATVSKLAGEKAVGLDAPLSYQPGGGDRPADKELRKRIVEAGMRPGSVMAPTATKMAYLTLRGISVARLLNTIQPNAPKIVEVHPGGTLALRGVDIAALKDMKGTVAARMRLLNWLEVKGLAGVSRIAAPGPDIVPACAAAFAAWKWSVGSVIWLRPACPPFHPYDLAC